MKLDRRSFEFSDRRIFSSVDVGFGVLLNEARKKRNLSLVLAAHRPHAHGPEVRLGSK
jgi:hypothetical protein